jgi:hypothetical protein
MVNMPVLGAAAVRGHGCWKLLLVIAVAQFAGTSSKPDSAVVQVLFRGRCTGRCSSRHQLGVLYCKWFSPRGVLYVWRAFADRAARAARTVTVVHSRNACMHACACICSVGVVVAIDSLCWLLWDYHHERVNTHLVCGAGS